MDNKACTHCGACRANCRFLEKYGIDIGDLAEREDLLYHCFLCGECTAVCPERIDGRQMVIDMRRRQVKENGNKLKASGYEMLIKEKENYIFKNYKNGNTKSVLFPGCNFPSFYPETTRKLIKILKNEADMGVLFDCCGKPVSELGLKEQEGKIIRRLNERLRAADIQEIVMLCPNCYYFLKDKLEIQVLSIYEKLSQLGIGQKVDGKGSLFLPCPDREDQQWVSWLEPFFQKKPDIIKGTQCCGLGGCAGGKEPELAKGMACHVTGEGYENVYTYCASCAGNLTRNGGQGVSHLLTEILDCNEQPDTAKSMINRMKTRFW